jgi:hypothetical protein
MTDFHGEPTQILENHFVTLEYLTTAPRIIRFAPRGRANLFVDLGLEALATPYGDFYFRGGHRLWHSPEAMPRTYNPDNAGAIITPLAAGARIDQPTEPGTGIAKSLTIELDNERAAVTVTHILRNDNPWAVELAPWALTMFRLGGVGIFPQATHDAGLLANRQLSLWSYTRINDPRLHLADDYILVHATAGLPPLKFGYFNPHGWQGYYIDGVLFVKRFEVIHGANFPDGGCNSETYTNNKFIELETLGVLAQIQPGAIVTHVETWEVFAGLDQSFIPASLRERILNIHP